MLTLERKSTGIGAAHTVAAVADRYIGKEDNGGPVLSPYEAIKAEIEDLFLEASNWADGEPIASPEQADEVTRLLDGIADAMKRADAARVDENKPFDDGKAEVQSRYNALIGKTKAVIGRAVMAKEALQAVLTPWRVEQERKAKAEAARVAEEARLAQEAAQAAFRGSTVDNLEERARAESLAVAAQDIAKVAKRADKAATTATGLRSVWTATMVDEEKAMDGAYQRAPGRFLDLAQALADEAVRGGLRVVPGFKITEERVAR